MNLEHSTRHDIMWAGLNTCITTTSTHQPQLLPPDDEHRENSNKMITRLKSSYVLGLKLLSSSSAGHDVSPTDASLALGSAINLLMATAEETGIMLRHNEARFALPFQISSSTFFFDSSSYDLAATNWLGDCPQVVPFITPQSESVRSR